MTTNDIFARVELLLGAETLHAIQSKKVILFGVGGVGSWCAEGLIRSGIMHLTVVDSDNVVVSNITQATACYYSDCWTTKSRGFAQAINGN